jgi:hypothetical protein
VGNPRTGGFELWWPRGFRGELAIIPIRIFK